MSVSDQDWMTVSQLCWNDWNVKAQMCWPRCATLLHKWPLAQKADGVGRGTYKTNRKTATKPKPSNNEKLPHQRTTCELLWDVLLELEKSADSLISRGWELLEGWSVSVAYFDRLGSPYSAPHGDKEYSREQPDPWEAALSLIISDCLERACCLSPIIMSLNFSQSLSIVICWYKIKMSLKSKLSRYKIVGTRKAVLCWNSSCAADTCYSYIRTW